MKRLSRYQRRLKDQRITEVILGGSALALTIFFCIYMYAVSIQPVYS